MIHETLQNQGSGPCGFQARPQATRFAGRCNIEMQATVSRRGVDESAYRALREAGQKKKIAAMCGRERLSVKQIADRDYRRNFDLILRQADPPVS